MARCHRAIWTMSVAAAVIHHIAMTNGGAAARAVLRR
jgi:hypothetical protein